MVSVNDLERFPIHMSSQGMDQSFKEYWLYSTRNIYLSGEGNIFNTDRYDKHNDGWMVMWI